MKIEIDNLRIEVSTFTLLDTSMMLANLNFLSREKFFDFILANSYFLSRKKVFDY